MMGREKNILTFGCFSPIIKTGSKANISEVKDRAMLTLTAQEISEYQFAIDTTSIYGVLSEIMDGANMVRFDYKGCALSPMQAAGRIDAGLTIDSVARGHVNHKNPMAFLAVGSRKDNLNIMFQRAMNTRGVDGSYDYRSHIIASPINGVNVKEIEACKPFGSWFKVNLSDLFVWPQLENSEDEIFLADALVVRTRLELAKEILETEKKRLQNQYRTWRKKVGDDNSRISNVDGVIYYMPPNGKVSRIIDENGNPVKSESFTVNNGVKIKANNVELVTNPLEGLEVESSGRSKGRPVLSTLPSIYRRLSAVNSEIKTINKVIRPFELGYSETNSDSFGDEIFIAGESMTLERFDVKESDYPAETAERLEKGEWKTEWIDSSRGQTKYEKPETKCEASAK